MRKTNTVAINEYQSASRRPGPISTKKSTKKASISNTHSNSSLHH